MPCADTPTNITDITDITDAALITMIAKPPPL
jgi:hypothetical protein